MAAAPSPGENQQFVSEEELASLYGWLDEIPLSRPKRNITRDFADGVLAAEVIAHYLPRVIEKHNYQTCAGRKQKKGNWDTLNKKVLKRFPKMTIPANVIDAIINMRPGVIEVVLIHLRAAIENHQGKRKRNIQNSHPEGYDEPKDYTVVDSLRHQSTQPIAPVVPRRGYQRRGNIRSATEVDNDAMRQSGSGKLGSKRHSKLPPIS